MSKTNYEFDVTIERRMLQNTIDLLKDLMIVHSNDDVLEDRIDRVKRDLVEVIGIDQ